MSLEVLAGISGSSARAVIESPIEYAKDCPLGSTGHWLRGRGPAVLDLTSRGVFLFVEGHCRDISQVLHRS